MKEVNRCVVILELVNNAELGIGNRVFGGMWSDNTKRLILLTVVLIGGVGWMQAQEKDMYGNTVDRELCEGVMGVRDKEINDLVTRIMEVINLPNRYRVGSCTGIDDAVATVDDRGALVLLYNPELLDRIKGGAFTGSDLPRSTEDWGVLLVFAHEISHHLLLHVTNPVPGMSNREMELEADEKAGLILYLLGAPDLVMAQSGLYGKQVLEEGSYLHPPRSERLEAFKKGWEKAEEKYPRVVPVPRPVGTPCSAMVSATERKEFMCHNLGAANMSADPFTPSWEITGGYWQWGRKEMAAAGPSGPTEKESGAEALAGWNPDNAPNGSWAEGRKTEQDPCPLGYRVPSISEWEGVLEHNYSKKVGSWEDVTTNYSSGRFFGQKLFLPAAGVRFNNDRVINFRGDYGFYWSSTGYDSTVARLLSFYSGDANTDSNSRAAGQSVRCISE